MKTKFYFNRQTLILVVITFAIIFKGLKAVKMMGKTEHLPLAEGRAPGNISDEKVIENLIKGQPGLGVVEDYKLVEIREDENFDADLQALLVGVTKEEFEKFPDINTEAPNVRHMDEHHSHRHSSTGVMEDKEKRVVLVKSEGKVELLKLGRTPAAAPKVLFSCDHVVGSEDVGDCAKCIARQMEEKFTFTLSPASKEDYPQFFPVPVEG